MTSGGSGAGGASGATMLYAGNKGTSDNTDLSLLSRLRQMFQYARDARRARYDSWLRNYRLVNNHHGAASSSWAPSPRDSEIYPVLSSLVAWTTDQDINISFLASYDPHSPIYSFFANIADDLSDVLYTTWMIHDYTAQEKLSLWDCFTYGVGIFKNVWDGSLDGGFGNAVLKRVDPWRFYVDPAATSTDDMEYCIEVHTLTYEQLERRFPDAARDLNRQSSSGDEGLDFRPNLYQNDTGRAAQVPGVGLLPTSGTFGSLGAVGFGTFDGRQRRGTNEPSGRFIVYEFWIHENKVYEYEDDLTASPTVEDEWRVVMMTQNVILLDEPASNLWSHGSHPYERFVFDDTGEFYGISLVDHLAHPQIYINRLLTALQQNAELTGNPIWVESANSGLSRVGVTNKPGQRLTVHGPRGMDNMPKWLEPPPMPQQIMELIQFWISRMENVSGLSALQKGITPTQRNAEGALNMVQEAAFVRVRAGLRNLQMTLQRCAYKLADLIIENFDEPRTMALLTPDGQQTAIALQGRHFNIPTRDGAAPLKYSIQVSTGADTPTSRSGRATEAKQMYALGLVDDQYVLEALRVKNIQKLLERKYLKMMQGSLGGGKTRGTSGAPKMG